MARKASSTGRKPKAKSSAGAAKKSANRKPKAKASSGAKKQPSGRTSSRKEPFIKKSETVTEITVIEGTCHETGSRDIPPRGKGRPTAYTPELAEEICGRLSEGETLLQICRDEHIPPRTTVLTWARYNTCGFSDRYAHARSLWLDALADEISDISDNGSNDWMQRELKGGRIQMVLNDEAVSRARLRVDSRKWLLEKLDPRFRRVEQGKPNDPPAGTVETEEQQRVDHLSDIGQRYGGKLKVINGGAAS